MVTQRGEITGSLIIRASLICILCLFVLGPTGAYSQTNSTLKASQLLGEWRSVKHNAQTVGSKKWDESTLDITIIINAVDKEIFEGKRILRFLAHDGHDGKNFIKEREMNILGTISLSGNKIFIITVGGADSAYYEGRFVNEHMIEWLGYESGEHGWIFRGTTIKK